MQVNIPPPRPVQGLDSIPGLLFRPAGTNPELTMHLHPLKRFALCLTIVAVIAGGAGCVGYDRHGNPVFDPAFIAPAGHSSGYHHGHRRYRHDDDDDGHRYHRRYRNDDDDDDGGHYRRYRGDDDDD